MVVVMLTYPGFSSLFFIKRFFFPFRNLYDAFFIVEAQQYQINSVDLQVFCREPCESIGLFLVYVLEQTTIVDLIKEYFL